MLFALQECSDSLQQHGDYHVPFFGNGYWTPEIEAHYGVTAQQAIEHSMSCCAQTHIVSWICQRKRLRGHY